MITAHGNGTDRHDAEPLPTRWKAAVFSGKTWVLRALRWGREVRRGRPQRFPKETTGPDLPVLAESRGRLFASDLAAEFALQAGKAQNLRLATAALHGLTIPAGGVFSFWTHVPRPTRRRGYVAGRELREGCVVPSVGGGLCQLSNALYDAALRAGFEIVERHAHSRRLPGSMAEAGRDATVFWNYVDLRFRPPADCRVEAFLTRDELVVRFLATGRETSPRPPLNLAESAISAESDEIREGLGVASLPAVESCETCGIVTCFRHPAQSRAKREGITAFLVDAWWPEFDRFLHKIVRDGDALLLPLDGLRLRLKSYRWNTVGFGRVRQAPRETLWRAWVSRRLASQGAARQRALMRFDASLAARFARMIPTEATHVIVSQNLLPFLWRSGVLGGRTFDVLMTRLPTSALQATLDRAASRYPESPTLADFRADPSLTDAEDAALAEADRWITPHSGIARLAGPRAHRLSWQLPPVRERQFRPPGDGQPFTALFPASTLGRKGAYELRAAARENGWRVRLGGPVLERADFWRGVETTPAAGQQDWDGIHAVMLPSWVENQPRRLLAALAAGVPVVASMACGLEGSPGIVSVPEGHSHELIQAANQLAYEGTVGPLPRNLLGS